VAAPLILIKVNRSRSEKAACFTVDTKVFVLDVMASEHVHVNKSPTCSGKNN